MLDKNPFKTKLTSLQKELALPRILLFGLNKNVILSEIIGDMI